MIKYIKLEDAIEKLDEWFCEPYTPTQLLSDISTIDIVRCEECRWQDDCSRFVKSMDGLVSTALTWCSDGERKDKEDYIRTEDYNM